MLPSLLNNPRAMPSSDSSNYSHESEYDEGRRTKRNYHPRKRRRLTKTEGEGHSFESSSSPFHFEDLFTVLEQGEFDDERPFEDVMEPHLNDLIRVRREHDNKLSEVDETGCRLRRVRPSDLSLFKQPHEMVTTAEQNILSRKVKTSRGMSRTELESLDKLSLDPSTVVHESHTSVDPEVINALYSIRTTPYANSFLSRIQGTSTYIPPGLLAVDWETRAPWMDLLRDIPDHFAFAHPEREHWKEDGAPITYSTLQASHLTQVHDLLERCFWAGIDVSDSLDYQPEQATIVAMYKKVVVGVAILKSPRETYIMYLAVKAGWEKAQIARTMLYHLIILNPQKDITLHVSTNNSAMLLYNQFGFKAEEFVAGFYDQYLDPNSRLSTNAFKLRLRHLPI